MNEEKRSRTPLDMGFVAVPTDVRAESDSIFWTRDEDNVNPPLEGFVVGAPVDRAIWEFLEMKTATADGIAEFAKRYGVLGIRSDGLPGIAPTHHRPNVNTLPLTRVEDADGYWYVEPAAPWRMYSVGLRAVLAAAIEIRNNRTPDWSTFIERWGLDQFSWEWFGLPTGNEGEGHASDLFVTWITRLSPRFLVDNLERVGPENQQAWLSRLISDYWIETASLTPILTWRTEAPSMSLDLSTSRLSLWPANSLFSVVVSQLIDILTGEAFERIEQCSVCGRLFARQPRPGPRTAPYCGEHRIEADRSRKRRWARKKSAEMKAKTIE